MAVCKPLQPSFTEQITHYTLHYTTRHRRTAAPPRPLTAASDSSGTGTWRGHCERKHNTHPHTLRQRWRAIMEMALATHSPTTLDTVAEMLDGHSVKRGHTAVCSDGRSDQ